VFTDTSTGYINGNSKGTKVNVQFGIKGGIGAGPNWKVDNAMVINYMSAHDNNTLWDKLAIANSNNTVEERLAMNRLGAAILFISKGTPFMQAGEEILRSKPTANGGFDHNSYKSSDEINNIRWDDLQPGTDAYEMMLYYAGLAEMRSEYGIFRNCNTAMSFVNLGANGGMAIIIDDYSAGDRAVVLINPDFEAVNYTLPNGEWKLVATGTQAGSEVIDIESGEVSVDGCSIRVYVK